MLRMSVLMETLKVISFLRLDNCDGKFKKINTDLDIHVPDFPEPVQDETDITLKFMERVILLNGLDIIHFKIPLLVDT